MLAVSKATYRKLYEISCCATKGNRRRGVSDTITTVLCMRMRAQQSARALVGLRVSSSVVGNGYTMVVPHKASGKLVASDLMYTTLRMGGE